MGYLFLQPIYIRYEITFYLAELGMINPRLFIYYVLFYDIEGNAYIPIHVLFLIFMDEMSPLTSFQNYGFYFLLQLLDASLSIFLEVWKFVKLSIFFIENMSNASIIFSITYKNPALTRRYLFF